MFQARIKVRVMKQSCFAGDTTMIITIAKTHNLTVDESKFSPEVRDFIWNYGLIQIIRDAGSMGKNPDEKLAMSQKRLDSLYAGKFRVERDPSAAADPVAAVSAPDDTKLDGWAPSSGHACT